MSSKKKFDFTLFREKHKTWITKGFSSETIDFAKEFGEYLGINQLTTSQIRNIYSEVMRITIANRDIDSTYQEFLLLKPKVAYAVNRIKEPAKGAANEFQRFFDAIYDAVNSVPLEERSFALNRFKNLFEAVLAYHKTKARK